MKKLLKRALRAVVKVAVVLTAARYVVPRVKERFLVEQWKQKTEALNAASVILHEKCSTVMAVEHFFMRLCLPQCRFRGVDVVPVQGLACRCNRGQRGCAGRPW